MGKYRLEIGGVDYSQWWVGMDSLKPSGPGSVGLATITIEKDAGGLVIRNKQVAKLWQAFDDLGNGVAQKGRYLIGIVDGKLTTSVTNIKQWQLQVVDCNILLKQLRIDAQDSAAITIPGGSFATQIRLLVEALQYQGQGTVQIPIDAFSFVADLVPTGMPAYTAKGKTLGQCLLEICQNAVTINTALRPLFYIGTDTQTWGAGEVVGGPKLHVYDGALMPAPLYTFSDNPTGSQRYRFGSITRKWESASLATRAQSVYGPNNQIATYADYGAGVSYPNPFINHGLPLNAGHWQQDLKKDTTALTNVVAVANLQSGINTTRFPREIYEHGADVIVLPGDVVTEIDSLEEGLSLGVNYRVVQSGIRVGRDTEPECRIVLNSRRLELLENGTEVLARPVEGDNAPPFAPTDLQLAYTWLDLEGLYEVTVTWTGSASRDVIRHTLYETVSGQSWVLPIGQPLTVITRMNPAQQYDFYATATDSNPQPHESGPSNHTEGQLPNAPLVSPPSSFTLASNVYNAYEELADITYTWSPSPDPSVVEYRVIQQEGNVMRTRVLSALLAAITITLIPGTLVQNARVYAVNSRGAVSVAAPSEAGLPTFTAAFPNYSTELTNPGFEIADTNDPTKPYKWARYVSGPGPSMIRDTTQSFSGPASLKLTTTAGGQRAAATSALVRVDGGAIYDLQGWVRQNTAGQNLVIYFQEYDIMFNYLGFVGGTTRDVNVAGSWVRIPLEGQGYGLRLATRYVEVVVVNDSVAGNISALQLWFDELKLIKKMENSDIRWLTLTGDAVANRSIPGSKLMLNNVTDLELSPMSGLLAKTFSLPRVTTTSKGRISAAVEQAGTSFPASPQLNDFFYRTDLGVLARWDGSRWRGPVDRVPADQWDAGPAPYTTASPSRNIRTFAITTDFALLLTRFYATAQVGSPNNGSNYWRLDLHYMNAGGDTVIAAVNTSASAVDTMTPLPAATSFTTNPLAIGASLLYVRIEPVGSPGPLLPSVGLKAHNIYT